MKRVALVALVAFAAVGCKVTVETKTRYVEDSVKVEDSANWAGEDIVINDEGVGISANGGLEVVVDPSVTKVTATARILAMSFEKPDADQSIADVKKTYAITRSGNTINVVCQHGSTHGESNGGESGCELLTVRIPGGTTNKLNLQAAVGNGGARINLKGAVGRVAVNSNGGDIEASTEATLGANISLVSEKADDVTLKLPANFAADEIQLVADEGSTTNAFPDAKIGAGAGGRGTAGTGAAAIKLTSKEFAGSSGKVNLAQQ